MPSGKKQLFKKLFIHLFFILIVFSVRCAHVCGYPQQAGAAITCGCGNHELWVLEVNSGPLQGQYPLNTEPSLQCQESASWQSFPREVTAHGWSMSVGIK